MLTLLECRFGSSLRHTISEFDLLTRYILFVCHSMPYSKSKVKKGSKIFRRFLKPNSIRTQFQAKISFFATFRSASMRYQCFAFESHLTLTVNCQLSQTCGYMLQIAGQQMALHFHMIWVVVRNVISAVLLHNCLFLLNHSLEYDIFYDMRYPMRGGDCQRLKTISVVLNSTPTTNSLKRSNQISVSHYLFISSTSTIININSNCLLICLHVKCSEHDHLLIQS